MRTRLLFLDDSGKPDPPHPSQVVAIAGFAIDSDIYPDFSRRVLGAKGRFFPNRGVPQAWELKSSRIIKPNPWKRTKNRAFCDELVRLIDVMGGSCFGATIDKRRLNHPMALSTTMPLQLQALVEHFDAECRSLGQMGMVIADWSSHQHDQHASQCVASFQRITPARRSPRRLLRELTCQRGDPGCGSHRRSPPASRGRRRETVGA